MSAGGEPAVVVVGSMNIDLITYAARLPERGETVMGERFVMGFGGKGANQAVMAARLGGAVAMIGGLGDDTYGRPGPAVGTFFVLPVYLKLVVGLDAFETGVRLVPMSVMMLVFALAGPRAAAKRSPRRVAQIGLAGLSIGSVILLATLDVEFNDLGFAIGLAVFGAGAGLLASPLGNVIMSSVDPSRTNEAGGLQGTAQNLGASMGTPLIGAILLAGLSSGFVERIATNEALPPETQAAIIAQVDEDGLDTVPISEAPSMAESAGLPPDQAEAVADDYAQAELDGLRNALFGVAVFAVLAFWFTRRLPGSVAAMGGTAQAG